LNSIADAAVHAANAITAIMLACLASAIVVQVVASKYVTLAAIIVDCREINAYLFWTAITFISLCLLGAKMAFLIQDRLLYFSIFYQELY
jgi:hypothetical protein